MFSQSNGNLIEFKLNTKYNSYRFLICSFKLLPVRIKVDYYPFWEWDHPMKSSGKTSPKSLPLQHLIEEQNTQSLHAFSYSYSRDDM